MSSYILRVPHSIDLRFLFLARCRFISLLEVATTDANRQIRESISLSNMPRREAFSTEICALSSLAVRLSYCILHITIRSLLFLAYSSAGQVTISLPSGAKTASTMIRWRQDQHSGSSTDEWSLNQIVISSNNLAGPTPINQLNFPRDFSSSTTFG